MDFKYDISWIMQVYLGDYPGSRKDSDKKFIRAVKSFLAVHKNDPRTQLIIVSDGCEITHKIYYENFAKYDCIEYGFISRPKMKMYDKKDDGSTFYRSLPRQVGRTIAGGFLHAFMDSDDFLLPTAAKIIKNHWHAIHKNNPGEEYMWAACSEWYENIAMVKWQANSKRNYVFKDTSKPEKIKGLKSKWVRYAMNEPYVNVLSSTWNVFHRWDCKTKWADMYSNRRKGEPSEDVVYATSIRKEGKGLMINDAIMVRCHYSGIWDY